MGRGHRRTRSGGSGRIRGKASGGARGDEHDQDREDRSPGIPDRSLSGCVRVYGRLSKWAQRYARGTLPLSWIFAASARP
jgi:hypothetical protein